MGTGQTILSKTNKTKPQRIAQVRAFLQHSGLPFEWRELHANTATAALAAQALACPVACIAKSIIFRSEEAVVLAVLCGDNRVDVKKISVAVGATVQKADAEFVKQKTGFEIGGVPPISHGDNVQVFLDKRLGEHPMIWAAAGSAYVVFGMTPQNLAAAVGRQFSDIAE